MNKTKKPSGARSKKSGSESSPGTTARGRGLLKALGEVREFLDGERELRVHRLDIPDPINVREIREKAGLSQAQFAARYAISPRTLQEWSKDAPLRTAPCAPT